MPSVFSGRATRAETHTDKEPCQHQLTTLVRRSGEDSTVNRRTDGRWVTLFLGIPWKLNLLFILIVYSFFLKWISTNVLCRASLSYLYLDGWPFRISCRLQRGNATLYFFDVKNEDDVALHTTNELKEIYYNKIYSDKWTHDQLTYINRQEYVNRFCKKVINTSAEVEKIDLILSNRELLEHILVDAKHNILYCYVPKVACTNWKRVFMIMVGMAKTSDILSIPPSIVHQQHFIPSLINFTSAQVREMLQTYTKFIFVRHPFERLVSAYRNKFEQQYNSSKYFQNRFGRKIVKIFRSNPSPRSLLKGDDVTFAEFVAYLTSKNSIFNEHWTPINKLCEPCLVNYDFIGKYETLNVDAQYFLNRVGSGDLIFPQIKSSNTSSHVTKCMSQLPYNSIIRLYKIYYNDFKLFQYSLQSYLGYELE